MVEGWAEQGLSALAVTLPRCSMGGLHGSSALLVRVFEMLARKSHVDAGSGSDSSGLVLADMLADGEMDAAQEEVCGVFVADMSRDYIEDTRTTVDEALTSAEEQEGLPGRMAVLKGGSAPEGGYGRIRRACLDRLASLYADPECASAVAARKALQAQLREVLDRHHKALAGAVATSVSEAVELTFLSTETSLQQRAQQAGAWELGKSGAVFEDMTTQADELGRAVVGTCSGLEPTDGDAVLHHALLAEKLRSSVDGMYDEGESWIDDFTRLLDASVEGLGGAEARVAALKEEGAAVRASVESQRTDGDAATEELEANVDAARRAMEVKEQSDRVLLRAEGEALETCIDGYMSETAEMALRLSELGEQVAAVQAESLSLMATHASQRVEAGSRVAEAAGKAHEAHNSGVTLVKTAMMAEANLSQLFSQKQTKSLQRVFEAVKAQRGVLEHNSSKHAKAAKARGRDGDQTRADYVTDLRALETRLSLMEKHAAD